MSESLEAKIGRYANAPAMLRESPQGPYALPLKNEHSNWRDEQEAWQKTAVLFDQSFHMTDVYFEGPDVLRLLSDLGVNSFRTFGADKSKQFVAVGHDGHVIGDAVLFGFSDTKASLVGRPAAPNWVAFHAETGGYDVQVTRDQRSVDNVGGGRLVFRYQIQGPRALDVIRAAADGPVPEVKAFTIGEFSIAGTPVRGLGHTMSRFPGMEITGLWDRAAAVKSRLLEAGNQFGFIEGGARSYPTTSLESGWIASPLPAIYSGDAMRPYREWLSAASWEGNASLGGSFVSDDIEDYYQTPWDLGYGRLIRFDHDFLGRDALEQLADQPQRRKVWLIWDDQDVTRLLGSGLFGGPERAKHLDLPLAVYCTFPFDRVSIDGRIVGLSAYTGYTTNIGHVVSLAMVDETDAVDGQEVVVVWGEPNGGTSKPTVERHVQTEVRARVSTTPPLAN